ncbi:MAG: hypothetical protein IJU68_03210 [Bacteroidales bacterium]|nr:hypothetical protein [Bacteroidales bacterium]
MKKILFTLLAGSFLMLACGNNKPVEPDEPDTPVFSLDSYNGHFAQAVSDAYDSFEKDGSLPVTVNVEGIKYTKAQYILASCMLLEAIQSNPDGWQDGEIDVFSAASGDEYRWNTYDPDTIDLQHISYMAGRILAYAKDKGSLPNYVTFPSDDTSSKGYMPKLTMVVTEHDNLMNLRACMVVLARTINYFVKSGGNLPAEVSSWPSSYLADARNCPSGDPVVKAAADAALSKLSAGATERQKAEAIFTYARDEWEWENYMNTRKGAVRTINEKGGNCCDLTHATLAMCHYAGIPARYLHGQCYFSSGVIGHVIPEIYVDGKWWICDPSNNSATFGTPTWKGMETFNGRYYELEF